MAGPRQAGKTTLAREIAHSGMDYLTLDDELSLLAAKEDPVGLIRERDRLVVDEVQRAPDLLLAIKRAVDQDRRQENECLVYIPAGIRGPLSLQLPCTVVIDTFQQGACKKHPIPQRPRGGRWVCHNKRWGFRGQRPYANTNQLICHKTPYTILQTP